VSQVTYYWHNGRSLGHTFESSKFIGALLATDAQLHVSAVTGAFRGIHLVPEACDVFKLPGFRNFDTGQGYMLESRLALPYPDLIALRSALIAEYLRRVRPDILVVNHEPRGYEFELEDALTDPSLHGIRMLSLRGVLDDVEATRELYFAADNGAFLLQHYDYLQVHIDPEVFDLADFYGLCGPLVERIRYVGYPDDPYHLPRAQAREQLGLTGSGVVVVAAMGGGQGAGELWMTLLRALTKVPEPDTVLILPGPYLEPAAAAVLATAAGEDPRIRVLGMVEDLRPYLAASNLFVGAGGASTTSEVLACRANAILVARQLQEREQEIHSRLLAERGLVRALRMDQWRPERVAGAIREALAAPLPDGPPPRLGGCRASARFLLDLLGHADQHRTPPLATVRRGQS
jgi:predicted glycosyltransferase